MVDISHWIFNAEEESAAHAIANEVATVRKDAHLPVYTGAVAIDGPRTLDRDDAINFRFKKNKLILETYIADPTQFIHSDDILDEASKKRVTTLYMPHNNYPMMPKVLCEDALSLNKDRLNPALRVDTFINTDSGKIEKITCERCLVEPENITYEEVAARIQRRDNRFAAWDKAAVWLRGIREKHATNVILPQYDPESGVMIGEDGRMKYVSPQVFNAHNIVQEAMIMANHSCARLMQECFDYGLYRGQNKRNERANYFDEPVKHASIGLWPYTHATSPNRRYIDTMVHRYLSCLVANGKFELICDGVEKTKLQAPLERKKQKEALTSVYGHVDNIDAIYKKLRNQKAEHWLEKVFPDTNPELLKAFDPVEFSILLNAAVESGKINDIFAHEVEERIKGRGRYEKKYGLIYPKDAVNLFRHAMAPDAQKDSLWDKIRDHVLERLAADPMKLDEVFMEFMEKIKGSYDLKQVSFITKPHKNSPPSVCYHPIASAIVATIDGKNYTSPEFAIAFSEGTSAMRAKIEFLRAYGASALRASDEPDLPREENVYLAKKLYIENVQNKKLQLLEDDYEIKTDSKIFGKSSDLPKGKGYKYTVEILKDGIKVLSVSVRHNTEEDAEKIGLETAIVELRGKGYLKKDGIMHTGLATFSGTLQNGHGVKYDHSLIVSPKRTRVDDPANWHALLDMLDSGGYNLQRTNKETLIISVKKSADRAPLETIKNLLIDSFPKITIVTQGNELTVKDPPRQLLELGNKSLQAQR